MKKRLIYLGISLLLLFGCGKEDALSKNTESSKVSSHETSLTQEPVENEAIAEAFSKEPEEKEPINRDLSHQKGNIMEVVSELENSLTYYQVEYDENSNAIVLYVDDEVLLDELCRAIDGQHSYIATFRDTGDTLQETSRLIARDSGVHDLSLLYVADLFEDGDPSLIFEFQNGERVYDLFEEFGDY